MMVSFGKTFLIFFCGEDFLVSLRNFSLQKTVHHHRQPQINSLRCITQVYHSNFWPLEWTVPARGNNICYAKVITNKADQEKVVGE